MVTNTYSEPGRTACFWEKSGGAASKPSESTPHRHSEKRRLLASWGVSHPARSLTSKQHSEARTSLSVQSYTRCSTGIVMVTCHEAHKNRARGS
jgi:hypothetical protein